MRYLESCQILLDIFERHYPNHSRTVPVCLAITALLFIVSEFDSAFGIEFSNHTSEKYRIQFQFPTSWNVTEKIGRFDEGFDLTVKDVASNRVYIGMTFLPESAAREFSTAGFSFAVTETLKEFTSDYSQEYTIIEEPTFFSIEGKQVGTFVYTYKDKYDTNALKWAQQVWIINAIDHGYLISFLAFPQEFDSPDNIAIRNQFIKSIKFLGSQ
jgi:hypothetical protein